MSKANKSPFCTLGLLHISLHLSYLFLRAAADACEAADRRVPVGGPRTELALDALIPHGVGMARAVLEAMNLNREPPQKVLGEIESPRPTKGSPLVPTCLPKMALSVTGGPVTHCSHALWASFMAAERKPI